MPLKTDRLGRHMVSTRASWAITTNIEGFCIYSEVAPNRLFGTHHWLDTCLNHPLRGFSGAGQE